jgi:hypothetical protein
MFGYKQRIFKSMSQRKEINIDVKIRQPGEQPVIITDTTKLPGENNHRHHQTTRGEQSQTPPNYRGRTITDTTKH